MKTLTLLLLRGYQRFISPPLHFLAGPLAGCRFTPSCSQYAIEAIQIHGLVRGGWLALRRLLRCQPWGGQGHDPVPPRPSSSASSVARTSQCGCSGHDHHDSHRQP